MKTTTRTVRAGPSGLEGAGSWGNFWALSLEIRTRVDKEEDEGQEGERCVISEGSPPELVKDSSKVSQDESPQTLTSQRPSLGPGPPDRSSGPQGRSIN